ncbi:MAG: Smr/MutS family protein, partial [Gemmatimonadota bacterium]
LRVIHGKGTGVLRETVAEYARSDRRVKSHRLGDPHEGGSGVTVLELE